MRDASRDGRLSLFGRRNFLRTTGVAAASLAMTGTASANHEEYETVVDVVEEGADDSGEESINPVLDDLEEDSILVEFPDGEYKMDRQVRHTGFSDYGLVAKGEDATIRPVPADDWRDDERRLFKLGTFYDPGGRLRVEGLTFDYTAPNTGLRAIQAQVEEPLLRHVDVVGRHDTGNWGPGPILVDVVDPDGTGLVDRVDLMDGGEIAPRDGGNMIGPIGFTVSPHHDGTLVVDHCRVFRFPNNGLYCSAEDGRTIVQNGEYVNNNVANIRLAGDGCEVRGAHANVTENPEGWDAQIGIRLDGGSGYRISDVRIYCPKPTANAIRVMSDADDVRIEDAWIFQGEPKADAVYVDDDAGGVRIENVEIRKFGPGQAIQVRPGGEPVVASDVRIVGDAPGSSGGRHAIRCERDGCAFRDLRVDQPGEDYRRCITLVADDCTVAGGTYTSTHHPIVVHGDGNTVEGVEARADNASEGVKVRDGHDVAIVDSSVWNGIDDRGSDVHASGNEYPES